jgi:hypothetical protein
MPIKGRLRTEAGRGLGAAWLVVLAAVVFAALHYLPQVLPR